MATSILADAASSESHIPNYHLVDLSERVGTILANAPTHSLRDRFGVKPPPPRQLLGIGDSLSISIFESAPGGLFSPPEQSITSGSRQEVLPNQVIDQSGYINVPYGGEVLAAGSTPSQVAKRIEKALTGRAIEPKAMVTAVETTANTATVLGEVGNPGRIKLSMGGDRILTVLAESSMRTSETEAVVRLVRRGTVQTVPLVTIVNVPSENIYVYPGDMIFVLKEPQVFNTMGAMAKPGQYPIGFSKQTVAGAISVSGGLLDSTADAGGVFLFRFESPETARLLLPPGTALKHTPSGVPIVYRVKFSDPQSFFWLQQMKIRNNDLIYAANALTAELQKFIGLISKTYAVGLRVL
ncbi:MULTISPECIES: polysaccharide biosynthesis/export family protein [unclassified Rhizobium]|uniref:polysaccharide biosynthesis/export family protein n=1 Tax=unclassified Rhizobium TaxID=2613769 RepID=UPI001AEB193E|nr:MULTISPECIES: polysaccharide biosynthesis/export family protein [unclassified Rhizobium]MBP2460154.1 polysaccharide export outer membrane protein [Rhizobium sp. PvP014]MBP2531513.1 polysaccharide export outer membrane protein [Rhizobium sp. PvP099]